MREAGTVPFDSTGGGVAGGLVGGATGTAGAASDEEMTVSAAAVTFGGTTDGNASAGFDTGTDGASETTGEAGSGAEIPEQVRLAQVTPVLTQMLMRHLAMTQVQLVLEPKPVVALMVQQLMQLQLVLEEMLDSMNWQLELLVLQ